MIEFKIVTTPDKSQQATYQHVGKELVIGRTEGDMLVDDPGMQPAQLKIRVEANGSATIENIAGSPEARLNGKVISGASPIKGKDNVTVARTTINFSRIDLEPLTPPEQFEHPMASVRVVPGSKEKAVLDALEYLEQQAPEGPAPGFTPTPPEPSTKPKPPTPGGMPPLPGLSMPPLPGRKS